MHILYAHSHFAPYMLENINNIATTSEMKFKQQQLQQGIHSKLHVSWTPALQTLFEVGRESGGRQTVQQTDWVAYY